MFLFETIALVLSVLAVALVHVALHLAPRRCPRCHLPAGEEVGREVLHRDPPELYETFETTHPALALVTPEGLVPVAMPADRPVRRLLHRRETLIAHRCRLCRHAWRTGEVTLVRGAWAQDDAGGSNVRLLPPRSS